MKDLVVFGDVDQLFSRVIDIKQIEFGERNLPEFANKFRKLVFFIFKEGILETYRKYKSLKWYNAHLEKYLTYILVEIDGKLFYNVSVQSQKESANFIIRAVLFGIDDLSSFYALIESEKFNFDIVRYNQYDNTDMLNKWPGERLSLPLRYTGPKMESRDSGLFLFGLGGYAFTHILPNLKGLDRIACVDYKYERAREFAEKFAFADFLLHPFQAEVLLKSINRPVVVIATYHSDHAYLAKWVYDVNPNSFIFVEKPPCITTRDLSKLREVYQANGKIEIGFNRRYSSIYRDVKNIVKGQKLFISISVKEVLIKDNHWYNWSNQGTRLSGNLVHWIDLGNYWVDSDPRVLVMNFSEDSLDDFTLSISYENGSMVNITCSDKGNSLRGVQELVELRFNQETFTIEDNLRVRHLKSNGRSVVKRYAIRDKGHSTMYKEFSSNYRNNGKFNYTIQDLQRCTLITVNATEMLRNQINVLKL